MTSTVERLVLARPDCPLLTGLLWRAPSAAGRSRTRALREAQALTSDASHYAAAESQGHQRYGMYQARASEEGLRLPKGTQSAAACFARLVGPVAPHAALVLMVPAGGARKEDRLFVVCLEDGVPAVDVLSNEVEARNALGAEDRPIWSDNPVAYPNSEPADFAWLAGGADRSTRVLSIPVNPWPGLAAAGVLGLALAGGWSLQRLQQLEQQKQAQAAARAADPVPRYLQALAAQRPAMASERQAWLQVAAELFRTPLWVSGWLLVGVDCDARRQRCTEEWRRQGGTLDDLRRAWPGRELETLSQPGAGGLLLDRARTAHAVALPRTDLQAGRQALPRAPAVLADAASLQQAWRDADIALDLRQGQLWPRLPGMPARFEHPQALVAGGIELRDVPGPFILEVLRAAPAYVSWETLHVEVGEGTDVRAALRFSATGQWFAHAG